MKAGKRFNKIFIFIILFTILSRPVFFADDTLNNENESFLLTDEEKDYILKRSAVKAVSLQGGAPIQYMNDKGEIQGISIEVLKEISNMTGLEFEYSISNSFGENNSDDFDIAYGIPPNYANYMYKDMILSKPYLKSVTILYFNSSIDSNQLDDKLYAAVKGSALPEGIKEENSVYFDTREESLNAVDSGIADYGYGNTYSVAYYTIRNNFKNIVTVPKEKELREYCIGFFHKDDLLISIINKALDSIDESKINNIIVDATSNVERKISLSMVIDAYGMQMFFIFFLVIAILTISVISNIRVNKKLKLQNKRYEGLAEISNEYIFEYCFKKNELVLSEKTSHLFNNEEDLNILSDTLKSILNNERKTVLSDVKINLTSGETIIFKVVFSYVFGDNKNVDCIIGKLTDISEEFSVKEKLISKSTIDGLTGLYNVSSVKELIEERLRNIENTETDAFVLLDVDNFKDINDSLGHLAGDNVLKALGEKLKYTFRKTDIIGRLGGDEFCVYLKDIPSAEFVYSKCRILNELIDSINVEIPVSISIGITLSENNDSYEELFKRADDAMYEGKRNGKGKIILNVINED